MASDASRHTRSAPAVPFRDAEEAWFWTMSCLTARRDGAKGAATRISRPCEPDDVVRALDQLYRRQRIGLGHAHVLRRWGERCMAPDPARPAECGDARLWREALDRLAAPLQLKGILG